MREGGFGSHGDGAGATPHSCGAFIFPFTFLLLPFPFLPVYCIGLSFARSPVVWLTFVD